MKEILVETSARHVHVTQETLEVLFGKGAELTVRAMLSQPGQFVSNQRIDLVGYKVNKATGEKIETRINQKAPLFIVKATKNVPITSKILEIAKGFNCSIAELNVELLDAEEVEVTFLLSTKDKDFDRNSFAAKLQEVEGVLHVSMVNNHKG